jgi:hypothetical protein
MAQAKKGVLDAVVKKAAGKIVNKMEKKAAKVNAKTAAKAAAYPAKQAAKTAKAEVKAAKKAASKEIRNAGKAGSRHTEKVTVGPKTRAKMAKGKFGNKAKAGKASVQKQSPTGNVKVKNNPYRTPKDYDDYNEFYPVG